jgi:Putative Actinobacterial Holin-X, holin superfamily III
MGAQPMEEQKPLTSNGEQETHADWATLIGQAVDDVSRIVHSESHLLQINLSAALKAQIDYALAAFAMVIALICAGICVLAALILVLHQSFQWWHGFPWWQAFAVGGFLMFVVGIAIHLIARHRRLARGAL